MGIVKNRDHRNGPNQWLRKIARENGLKVSTVENRYYTLGWREYASLVQPVSHRGKLVAWEGRTYDEWLEWLRKHGRHLSKSAVTGARHRQIKKGLSEKEALHRFLKIQGLLEEYLKECNTEE